MQTSHASIVHTFSILLGALVFSFGVQMILTKNQMVVYSKTLSLTAQRVLGVACILGGLATIAHATMMYGKHCEHEAVTLYSLKGCKYCVEAKRQLQARNVKFTEIEFNKDNPQPMPDGRVPTSFPQIWTHRNMGGLAELDSWTRSVAL